MMSTTGTTSGMSSTTTVPTTTTTTSTTATTTTTSTTPTMTRTIHPCVMDRNQYNRGIEFTTWAYLLASSSDCRNYQRTTRRYPNLVTASSNSICIYTIIENDENDENNNNMDGKVKNSAAIESNNMPISSSISSSFSSSSSVLQLVPSNISTVLSHLAGSIISLQTIPSPPPTTTTSTSTTIPFHPDALLIGFAGHPRCVVLTIVPQEEEEEEAMVSSSSSILLQWQVSCLLDLSPILMDYSLGATTIYEQDMILTINNTYDNRIHVNTATTTTGTSTIQNHHHHHRVHAEENVLPTTTTTTMSTTTTTTAACILGGGIALALMTFHHHYQYHYTHDSYNNKDVKNHATNFVPTLKVVVTTDEPYLIPLAFLPLSQYHPTSHGTTTDPTLSTHHHHYNKTLATAATGHPDMTTTTSATTTTIGGNATTTTTTNSMGSSSIPTGFGDILDALFLNGYRTEPVLVVLHSTNKYGKITTHRFRPHRSPLEENDITTTSDDMSSSSYHSYYYCTALSISTIHHRTAILWSVPIPYMDVLYLNAIPSSSSSTNHQNHGFVVVSNNTLTFMNSIDGSIQQCIAVNGWAGATSTTGSSNNIRNNKNHPTTSNNNTTRPVVAGNPILKLSIQLDGCQITWITSTYGILVLRYGQVYTIQYISQLWTILPLGQQLTGIGEMATCCSCTISPSSSLSLVHEGYLLAGSRLGNSLWIQFSLDHVTIPMEIKDLLQKYKNRDVLPVPETTTAVALVGTIASNSNDDDQDMDDILRMEDEALYGSGYLHDTDTTRQPDLIPPSDDDDDHIAHIDESHRSRRSMRSVESTMEDRMTIVRTFTPMDCIVNVGPLGPSCSGPIDKAPLYLLQNNPNDEDGDSNMNGNVIATQPNHSSDQDKDSTIYGAVAEIYPSGYGSSGGIAYMTVPGRDDRMIVSETDCLQNECIFTLSYHGIALLGMSPSKGNPGGIRILKQQMNYGSKSTTGEMKEMDLNEWCSDEVGVGNTNYTSFGDVFQSTLLGAGEFAFGQWVILVVKGRDTSTTSVVVGKYNTTNEKLDLMRHQRIDLPKDHMKANTATITNVSPIVEICGDPSGASFGCVWSNGDATLVTINMDGDIVSTWIEGQEAKSDVIKDEMDIDGDEDDTEAKEIETFYSDKSIVAVDVFHAPVYMFEVQSTINAGKKELANDTMDTRNMPDTVTSSIPVNTATWHVTYDAEDEELYSMSVENKFDFPKITPLNTTADPILDSDNATSDNKNVMGTYFAVCRKLGNVDIYEISAPNTVISSIRGTNLGLPLLTTEHSSAVRATEENRLHLPRSHCIAVSEMRFFVCSPTMTNSKMSVSPLQNLCLAIVTSEGDMYMYVWSNRCDVINMPVGPTFRRVPLRSVSRISQEQIRHRAKLSRKGVLGKDDAFDMNIVYNTLHRFNDISGQDGLFAALARPQWFVCERGQVVALDHRMRHAAPAGGSIQPIKSFGSIRFLSEKNIGKPPLPNDTCGYITVHERVGRVGSQRLSIFKGLSDVFESNGILLGNGCCMEKVMLGVTVRRIVFIDDDTISTGDHPLYAVLVSREVEVDQSDLNTDGLSGLERQMREQEREAMKIQKQVEADLGGFDMESEWVESIERENAFHIQTELGGAPPIHQSIYSLWIIDAANKWMVIDSYQLDEYEHGIDLKMLYLTEFQDETGGTTPPSYDPNSDEAVPEVRKRLFIALGTGIVNQDGEDVTAKGRVLLFNVKRSVPPVGSSPLLSSTAPFAELTLAYEKTMFHGPVTTLSCLVSDNDKQRLVIGAGSDINIEMWNEPQSKLIQVGFFRATMHILNIVHFKNFLLLSDAYDSIYLLVFRESDKSLTLLAKDYDPIPVYATGIMTRGAAMTFVCHDDRQNLQFFQYAPGEAAARGGNKLVCRADFHLGKQTTSFRPHYCRPSLYIHSATPASTLSALKQQDALFGRQDDDQRIGVNFGTSDGNVISIIPLSEPIYWRLMALQSVMSNALESDCVLNHRAWRLYRRSIRRGGCRNNDRKKGVIDGDLILKYPDLPISQQEDLASAIGSTVELILDNLLEAQCASMIL